MLGRPRVRLIDQQCTRCGQADSHEVYHQEVVAAAQRLEKAAAMFEELREVLRFSSRPHERLLRGRSPAETPEVAQKMEARLEQWRDRLRQWNLRERDADKRADQETVLGYLQKYEYVDLVCDLSLANLPAVIAKYWGLAQAIRAERLQSKTDHPMPTSKKQLRNSQLLDSLQQTLMNIVETISAKPQAV